MKTHNIVFLSHNVRNTLADVIRENGISPDKLMQDWNAIERGLKTWLESEHLNNIVIEFFKPGATAASARLALAFSCALENSWVRGGTSALSTTIRRWRGSQ